MLGWEKTSTVIIGHAVEEGIIKQEIHEIMIYSIRTPVSRQIILLIYRVLTLHHRFVILCHRVPNTTNQTNSSKFYRILMKNNTSSHPKDILDIV